MPRRGPMHPGRSLASPMTGRDHGGGGRFPPASGTTTGAVPRKENDALAAAPPHVAPLPLETELLSFNTKTPVRERRDVESKRGTAWDDMTRNPAGLETDERVRPKREASADEFIFSAFSAVTLLPAVRRRTGIAATRSRGSEAEEAFIESLRLRLVTHLP
jgi:hypothetical protein